jgi:hypothetical protein
MIAATALLFELGTAALVQWGPLETPEPTRSGTGFWDGDHPELGVWHQPNASWEHTTACFHVRYESNSVGARDRERSPGSSAPRVVVLGDSFLEGWGLPAAQRLSNRLEAETGVEHLNFAMAHFGPYQQWLAYEGIARRFAHSAVLASLLPLNDVVDSDLELAVEMRDYDYRYRPYLVRESGRWHRFDHREPALRRALRRHSYAFNALLGARRALTGELGAPPAVSRYYELSEPVLTQWEEILGRLRRSAGERAVALLLIPAIPDFERYARGEPAPLSERIAAIGRHLDIQVVDLLPAMAEMTRGWKGYFHSCDHHWNGFANSVAARIVLEALGDEFYGRAGPGD